MGLPAFGTCVWDCGRNDFNREHVIGLQIAKLLDTTTPITVRYGGYSQQGEVIEVILKDRVCKGCNNKWMRKLDERMVGFMHPAIARDEPITLRETQQRTLSHWATKVALLFLLHMNDSKPVAMRQSDLEQFYAPADNFAAIFARQRPPQGTRVWLGALKERTADRLTVLSGSQFAPPDFEPFGYSVTIVMHRLIFIVRGVELTYSGDVALLNEPFDRLVPDALLSIWPTTSQELSWPPTHEFSVDEISRIGNMPRH